MDIKIIPSSLKGEINAISSKSDTHRLLIAASLSDTKTCITTNILSKDIEATIDCLISLGGEIFIEKTNDEFNINVFPIITASSPFLDCKESGSTARFLLPISAVISDNTTLVGSGKLPSRPFSPLVTQMQKNGCSFSSDCLPMTVSKKLHFGEFTLDGEISSQFVSGLLLALPLLDGDSKIILNSPLQSAGYVDMTIDTLLQFGIEIKKTSQGFYIKGNQKYHHDGKIKAEGDWSNSAFWLCGGAICGNVLVNNLSESSLQKDKKIIELLKLFGADIKKLRNGFSASYNTLNSLEIDAGEIPDLVPILAAVAAVSNRKTTIYNAKRLKFKESDRLQSTKIALNSIGADITTTDDKLIINGKNRLIGGTCDSFNDHRIAMAVAIAGCACTNEVIITNAQAVEKSYPTFFEHYNSLGGKAYVL